MKTIKRYLLTSSVLLFLTLSGCIECFDIRGNGIIESESRHTGSFYNIKSCGEFEVHVSQGYQYDVVVDAETNLLPFIETEVHGETLEIRIEEFHLVQNTRPMKVYITTPSLKSLKESGSGIITTDFFKTTSFDVSVSGSGRIETDVECTNLNASISGSGRISLSGAANLAEFKISGSGKVSAYNMAIADCEATISGSGDLYVNVEGNLDASVSGSGNVFYIGHPKVHSHISGSGKIINDN
jgi:hypothetical protein